MSNKCCPNWYKNTRVFYFSRCQWSIKIQIINIHKSKFFGTAKVEWLVCQVATLFITLCLCPSFNTDIWRILAATFSILLRYWDIDPMRFFFYFPYTVAYYITYGQQWNVINMIISRSLLVRLISMGDNPALLLYRRETLKIATL